MKRLFFFLICVTSVNLRLTHQNVDVMRLIVVE